jgi:hypothetical protein
MIMQSVAKNTLSALNNFAVLIRRSHQGRFSGTLQIGVKPGSRLEVPTFLHIWLSNN